MQITHHRTNRCKNRLQHVGFRHRTFSEPGALCAERFRTRILVCSSRTAMATQRHSGNFAHMRLHDENDTGAKPGNSGVLGQSASLPVSERVNSKPSENPGTNSEMQTTRISLKIENCEQNATKSHHACIQYTFSGIMWM